MKGKESRFVCKKTAVNIVSNTNIVFFYVIITIPFGLVIKQLLPLFGILLIYLCHKQR